MINDKKVSIIIATSNRYRLLENTLTSLEFQSFRDFEVVLICIKIDNQLREIASRFGANLYEDGGKGRCYARNLGIEKSKGEIIVILDDDVVLDKDWLKLIMKTFALNSNIGGVGGLPINIKNNIKSLRPFINKMQGLSRWEDTGFRYRVNYLSGCNMAFNREILLRVNGFDENFYGPSCGEDADICLRVIKEGFSLIFEPGAKVKHNSDYINRTLKYKNNARYFYSIADNETYWRVKNGLLKGILIWLLYLLHEFLKALFWTFNTFNVKIFFNYIKGILIGRSRALTTCEYISDNI